MLVLISMNVIIHSSLTRTLVIVKRKSQWKENLLFGRRKHFPAWVRQFLITPRRTHSVNHQRHEIKQGCQTDNIKTGGPVSNKCKDQACDCRDQADQYG